MNAMKYEFQIKFTCRLEGDKWEKINLVEINDKVYKVSSYFLLRTFLIQKWKSCKRWCSSFNNYTLFETIFRAWKTLRLRGNYTREKQLTFIQQVFK